MHNLLPTLTTLALLAVLNGCGVKSSTGSVSCIASNTSSLQNKSIIDLIRTARANTAQTFGWPLQGTGGYLEYYKEDTSNFTKKITVRCTVNVTFDDGDPADEMRLWTAAHCFNPMRTLAMRVLLYRDGGYMPIALDLPPLFSMAVAARREAVSLLDGNYSQVQPRENIQRWPRVISYRTVDGEGFIHERSLSSTQSACYNSRITSVESNNLKDSMCFTPAELISFKVKAHGKLSKEQKEVLDYSRSIDQELVNELNRNNLKTGTWERSKAIEVGDHFFKARYESAIAYMASNLADCESDPNRQKTDILCTHPDFSKLKSFYNKWFGRHETVEDVWNQKPTRSAPSNYQQEVARWSKAVDTHMISPNLYSATTWLLLRQANQLQTFGLSPIMALLGAVTNLDTSNDPAKPMYEYAWFPAMTADPFSKVDFLDDGSFIGKMISVKLKSTNAIIKFHKSDSGSILTFSRMPISMLATVDGVPVSDGNAALATPQIPNYLPAGYTPPLGNWPGGESGNSSNPTTGSPTAGGKDGANSPGVIEAGKPTDPLGKKIDGGVNTADAGVSNPCR